MTIWIYNTLTRTKELFQPTRPEAVGMYFCGPTVYADTHIGHLRPALTGDVIARWLRYRGYNVRYIVNFTDIDDKIILKARETGQEPLKVSQYYIDQYMRIMERLGADQVDEYPRVTEHIPEIIRMIEQLVEAGFAYELEGSVYYSVQNKDDYGKLAGRRLDDMLAGARVEVNERKRHPMDFALWKAVQSDDDGPSWPSPWGPGRPGWHIECSAMSIKYLGETFDIHGGGDDLIFPHHENEIAQSEASTGKPFAKYWVHNGMMQVDDEKMSKSLGNFVTAESMLDRFPAPVIRLFLFTAHYRTPLNFSDQALAEARRGWERLQAGQRSIKTWLDRTEQLLQNKRNAAYSSERHDETVVRVEAATRTFAARCELLHRSFTDAMDDDFNTARALGVLFDLVRDSNRFLHEHVQPYPLEQLAEWPLQTLQSIRSALQAAAQLLELGQSILGVIAEPERGQAGDAKAQDVPDHALVDDLVALIIDVRQQARSKKDWATADAIRDGLARLGIRITDTPQGTNWEWLGPLQQSDAEEAR